MNNYDVVYTKLVVYDLKDEKKIKIVVPNLIDVSRKFGFYADNDSPFVVELHGDIPDGEVIAALAPFETNKYIFLKPRSDGLSYDFYPTWVYVNPRTNENTTISSGINDKRHAYPEAIDEKKYRVYGLNALLNQTLNTTLNVEFDASSKMTIAPTTFMSGYKYELIITDMNGNYEYGIREVGKKSIVEDACIELFME